MHLRLPARLPQRPAQEAEHPLQLLQGLLHPEEGQQEKEGHQG